MVCSCASEGWTANPCPQVPVNFFPLCETATAQQVVDLVEWTHSLLKFGNNAANDRYTERCKEAGVKIHPAHFPAALPEFFIKRLTGEGDIVLDLFAGSNTTGAVAEKLCRRWIAIEKSKPTSKSLTWSSEPILI